MASRIQDVLHAAAPQINAIGPDVVAVKDWMTGPIFEAQPADAATVHVEATLGELRPDVVFVTAGGRELLVEIRVTHAVDKEKRHRL